MPAVHGSLAYSVADSAAREGMSLLSVRRKLTEVVDRACALAARDRGTP